MNPSVQLTAAASCAGADVARIHEWGGVLRGRPLPASGERPDLHPEMVTAGEAVWVFDVDGTLIDSLTGTSLRPGALELLASLRSHGRTTLLWSAGGASYARRRASEHRITHLVQGFHGKGQRGSDGRYVPSFLDDPARATFVDDRPDDLPIGSDVRAVSCYIVPDPHDSGLSSIGPLLP